MGKKLDELYDELTGKPATGKVYEFEMDLKGNFSWVHPDAAALVGYTPKELEDVSLWDVLSDKDHDRIAKKLEARRKGEPVEPYEASLRTKQGAEVKIHVETSPIIEKGKVVRIKGRIRPI